MERIMKTIYSIITLHQMYWRSVEYSHQKSSRKTSIWTVQTRSRNGLAISTKRSRRLHTSFETPARRWVRSTLKTKIRLIQKWTQTLEARSLSLARVAPRQVGTITRVPLRPPTLRTAKWAWSRWLILRIHHSTQSCTKAVCLSICQTRISKSHPISTRRASTPIPRWFTDLTARSRVLVDILIRCKKVLRGDLAFQIRISRIKMQRKPRLMEVRDESRRMPPLSLRVQKCWPMKIRESQLTVITIIIFSTLKPTTLLSKTSTRSPLKWTTSRCLCHHSTSTTHTVSTRFCSNKWRSKISTFQWCLISPTLVEWFPTSSSPRTSSRTNRTNQTSSITLKTSTIRLNSKPTITP